MTITEFMDLHGIPSLRLLKNPSYETAVVGVTNNGLVVYDYNKMIEYLMNTSQMTSDEAVEFIEYNTLRALPYFGVNAPVIVYPCEVTEADYASV